MSTTFMPRVAIRESDAKIRYIPFQLPIPSRTIVGLVWRKTSARSNLTTEVIGLIQREAGKSSATGIWP